VSLGQRLIVAADILGGRRVSIRIDTTTLSFFDPETRQLLRTRPNPLSADEVSRLRGLRPPDRPRPLRRIRCGCSAVSRPPAWSWLPGRPVALGRVHAGKTVTIEVTDTELVVACDDGPRTVRRSNQLPIRNLKADRPRELNIVLETQRGKPRAERQPLPAAHDRRSTGLA
jgi:hypothetical protein